MHFIHTTPVFLPAESHGQRSLVGHSPQGHKESGTTEATQHVLTHQNYDCVCVCIYIYIYHFTQKLHSKNLSSTYIYMYEILIANTCIQPSCPSIGGWFKKLQYSHSMDYCASQKRMKKNFLNYFRNSFKTLSDQIKVQNFMKGNLTFIF